MDMSNCMGLLNSPMGGAMMAAAWLQWLLFVSLTVLGIVALVRYLRTPRA